jgi:hypothetical protein
MCGDRQSGAAIGSANFSTTRSGKRFEITVHQVKSGAKSPAKNHFISSISSGPQNSDALFVDL